MISVLLFNVISHKVFSPQVCCLCLLPPLSVLACFCFAKENFRTVKRYMEVVLY